MIEMPTLLRHAIAMVPGMLLFLACLVVAQIILRVVAAFLEKYEKK